MVAAECFDNLDAHHMGNIGLQVEELRLHHSNAETSHRSGAGFDLSRASTPKAQRLQTRANFAAGFSTSDGRCVEILILTFPDEATAVELRVWSPVLNVQQRRLDPTLFCSVTAAAMACFLDQALEMNLDYRLSTSGLKCHSD